MSLDKLVDSTQLDADLTSVANAIRAKSGGSSQLAFPSGFVSEIQAIPSGGGGDYVANDWVDLSKPTGEIVSDIVFADSSSGGYTLYGRTGITKFVDLEATGFGQQFFAYCTGMKYLVIPKAILNRSSIAAYCSALIGVDFIGAVGSTYVFRDSSKLKYLVLRGATQRNLAARSMSLPI